MTQSPPYHMRFFLPGPQTRHRMHPVSAPVLCPCTGYARPLLGVSNQSNAERISVRGAHPLLVFTIQPIVPLNLTSRSVW